MMIVYIYLFCMAMGAASGQPISESPTSQPSSMLTLHTLQPTSMLSFPTSQSTSKPICSPTLRPTSKPSCSPTSQPTSMLSFGVATTASIYKEGLACFAMAAAMPSLKTLTVTSPRTVWTTSGASWGSVRKLIDDDDVDSLSYHIAETVSSVQRSFFTTQPFWCSFYGVSCGTVLGTSSYANIQSISLIGLSLNGTLPSSVGALHSMTLFSVYGNSLTGTIPTAFGDLNLLQSFDVQVNSIVGTIPSTLSKMKSLTTWDFSFNSMTGTIPTFIGSMQSLTKISFNFNRLSGTIPESIFTLTSLASLNLNGNRLVGTISSTISSLTCIFELSLGSNSLTGTIPSTISLLTVLTFLSLSNSNISGTIPSGLGSLSSITALYLNNNRLVGTIPSSFGGLSSVDTLSMSSNRLTGSIPSQIASHRILQNVALASNSLDEKILSQISLLSLGDPTGQPTSQPSGQPTTLPSGQPTSQPSGQPTGLPSGQPTTQPSGQPTDQPTALPSGQPTAQPSGQPTGQPSAQPTGHPSRPTGQPTAQPTGHPSRPTGQPSAQPTGRPTGQPTAHPTGQPSGQPTGQPTVQPSRLPSGQPTAQPSGQPTGQPTSLPSGQPSGQPTAQPSGQPTGQPTSLPSGQPTGQPSGQPTAQPSGQPTGHPIVQPSGQPTGRPSGQPTAQPSGQPTGQPTVQPSGQPTGGPSGQPTAQPSGQPTRQPTSLPSGQPTGRPSGQPTAQPSGQPTGHPIVQPSGQPTGQPSGQPTAQPSGQPTGQPTSLPSGQPTGQPSGQPTAQPSGQPTGQPTSLPSGQPTGQPSGQPTAQPSGQPTGHPIVQPTGQPTGQPSGQPTAQPSGQPTGQPTVQPSGQPTGRPSGQPTAQPSGQPTGQPTSLPSGQPTGQPSGQPTAQPSGQPTGHPIVQPSGQPTGQPSGQPTAQPSGQPTGQPTSLPSGQPTGQPSGQPTAQPSGQPTGQPTSLPSGQPTGQPSGQPTAQPSGQPTGHPIVQPSGQPTGQPSGQPTAQPSGQPTGQPTSQPSRQPTGGPSGQPTAQPSGQPTRQPTSQPSGQPTGQPSGQPTAQPSGQPTGHPIVQPSGQPTGQPSGQPTAQPSGQPTGQPTSQPSGQPTGRPSGQPTAQPSGQPTGQPTSLPSGQPTGQPSGQPTAQPSGQPTGHPIVQPSGQPTGQPSGQPTAQPSGQPTGQPTSQPSGQPSRQPSGQPTAQPSGQPTGQPTSLPSGQPTGQPSGQPTAQPSGQPTGHPIVQPSGQPTEQPSGQPTAQPSGQPTGQPTSQPSGQPTGGPSGQPTAQPSGQPTCQPTSLPSGQPTGQPSGQPTAQPSGQPTGHPIVQPSGQPTGQPSGQPTAQPSGQPTGQPTSQPSGQPTGGPSGQPTAQPSGQPTGQPTALPSGQPTGQPSGQPTAQPSGQPTGHPIVQPTGQPSGRPTGQPTSQPSGQPTGRPSGQPTAQPSGQPTGQPTAQPSGQPTGQPSGQPTAQPSGQPTGHPIVQPTGQPSGRPTGQPTSQPSGQPTGQPSGQPTAQPSGQPTRQPTSQPSRQPTGQPSGQPTAQPSGQPTGHPIVQPTGQPSGRPTGQPTSQPSGQPTGQPSGQPTAPPSGQPTGQPTALPSGQPTGQPSGQPTAQPSGQPTGHPIVQPTGQPSGQPTGQPTSQPSGQPTGQPSGQPTAPPSGQPTGQPTSLPSGQPTGQPSGQPTAQPSGQPTGHPIVQPTGQPSGRPTGQPTSQPSGQPTGQPSGQPTAPPSGQPTGQPTSQPSGQPTGQPSGQPTAQPSGQPTGHPIVQPTGQPSGRPTGQPTSQPSGQPTGRPSGQPTAQPSGQPTRQPTSLPSGQPTGQPSGQPTAQPSGQPTGHPIVQPTGQPSGRPTGQPTSQPSGQPTGQPSGQPTAPPSGQPTRQPTAQPSRQPTGQPSGQPTAQPSGQPTGHPIVQPTGQPSGRPTGQPTSQPTGHPIVQPSGQPTGQPSRLPTAQPSGQPTGHPIVQPSGQPTGQPSSQPTGHPIMQPTAQPTGQPSGRPTGLPSQLSASSPRTSQPTVYPTSSSYQALTFYGIVTMDGLDSSMISSSDFKTKFVGWMAKSMTGVRMKDIKVVDLSYVKNSAIRSAFISEEIPVSRDSRMTRDFTVEKETNGRAQSTNHESIATISSATTSFNCTAVLTRLGTTNSSSAYASLVAQLKASMTSGDFLQLMKSSSTALNTVSLAYFTEKSYTVALVSNPTSSPTSAPTVIAIIPSVSYITVTDAARSSLDLSVNLVKARIVVGDTTGGNLYCTAIKNGTILSSIGALKSSSFDGSVSRGSFTAIPADSTYPITLTMTINNVDAIQLYSIYCYVETAIGTGNSYEAVISTRVYATTACCKIISYTNSPAYVYSDVTKYSASSSSLYVFTYVLPSLPLSTLKITPKLYLNGVQTNTVTATPASSSFANRSLTGQFFLSASPSAGDTCVIYLSFSGSQARLYSSRNATVELLASYSQSPAPWMVSSRLSDSGQSVTITFNSPTDQAGIATSSWTCTSLFSFIGASLSTCSWLTAKTVRVSFPVITDISSNDDYISTGYNVTLLGGKLRAFCYSSSCSSNPTATSGSVVTLAPINPSAPIVIISTPPNIGSCSNLSLDATASYGNGGRMYSSVVWTVSAIIYGANSITAVNTSILQNSLNKNKYQVQKPINIASTSLKTATYAFTLRLTNFLGLSSTSTVEVVITSDRAQPSLTIIGPSYRAIIASSSLSILSTATLPICSFSSSLEYTWNVKLRGSNTAIKSISPDQSRFSLAPYSLTVDELYTITVTATAGKSSTSETMQVYVAHGNLTAAVVGGYTRSVPVDKDLVLDASISTDDDYSSSVLSAKVFQWSCTIASLTDFGQSCNLFAKGDPVTSAITILANTMAFNTLYALVVHVSTSDGRTSTKTVKVTADRSNSVVLSISTSFVRFNPGAKLVINADITAPYAVTSQWTAYTALGVLVPFTALTSTTKDFSSLDATSSVPYPLSVGGGVFTAGTAYSFRLTSYPTSNPKLATFSQIVLTANAPPTGGYVSFSPPSGNALVTLFIISTPGWTTDASNFPLQYAFSYRISSSSALLTLASLSLRAFTTATLPSGLSSLNYAVTLNVQATDILNSTSTATASVIVRLSASTNVSNILTKSLTKAFSVGNINSVYQAVNNVATTINLQDCSTAPNCTALFRDHCHYTVGTCGPCFKNFTGVVGDSNVLCHHDTSSIASSGAIGSSCSIDSDCLYGRCLNNICIAPTILCPTATLGKVCSGNGTCIYSNPSGNVLSTCTILDVTCTASCACIAGYGGKDCSLTSDELAAKNDLRTSLCQAIVTASNKQDKSFALLVTSSASLFSSFSPYEVTSSGGRDICATALLKISTLARNGYLQGSYNASQLMADVISSYTVLNNVTATNATTAYTQYPVNRAITSLVSGVQQGMAAGESAISLLTSKLQLTVTSALVSDIKGASFVTPSTDAQLAYGSIQSKITLGAAGLTNCTNIGKYTQMAVLQWSINPYASSQAVKSPLLRFSSTSQTDVTTAHSASRKRSLRTSNKYILPGVPAYFIAIQFSKQYHFNFSAGVNYTAVSKSRFNYTLPTCTQYDGIKYVHCHGCNISSYTNYNVTYSCYDVTQICPKSVVRRLLEKDDDDITLSSTTTDDKYASTNRVGNGVNSRFLAFNDDIGLSTASPATYGTFVTAIAEQIVDVLSINPFALNVAQSVVVLTFVGCLAGTMCVFLLFFLLVDKREKVHNTYIKTENMKKARQLLKEDIMNGKNEDPNILYRDHLSKCKLNKDSGAFGKKFSFGFQNPESRRVSTTEPYSEYPVSHLEGEYAYVRHDSKFLDANPLAENESTARATITEFFHAMFPGHSIFGKSTKAISIITVNHDYLKMFGSSTMVFSRTVRFLSLMCVILTTLFADTLFFGVFFPPNICEPILDEVSCTANPSKIEAKGSVCTWSEDASPPCSPTPPPSDLVFTVVVSLMVVIFSIPMMKIVQYVLEEYASKQPSNSIYGDKEPDDKLDEQLRAEENDASAIMNDARFGNIMKGSLAVSSGSERISTLQRMRFSYSAFATPVEETQSVIDRVHRFLFVDDDDEEYYWLPWATIKETDHRHLGRMIKIEAIEEHLGVASDGSFVPLTLRQRIFWSSPLDKLQQKIGRIRRQTASITEYICSTYWHDDLRDTALIREFILECLAPFKRFTLKKNNSAYDEVTYAKISWLVYGLAWIFVAGSLLFYLYWIFAWGVYEGDAILSVWGAVFGTASARDILLVQVTKIYIIFYLPALAMQAQLLRIRSVLADISMNYINYQGHQNPMDEEENDVVVIQHVSATCRAARSPELYNLPAAWLLRQIDDVDVKKCRDGRLHYLGIISYVIISVPMTCILLNEDIGDVIVDAFIPAFFSAIMVVGESLYSISLAALLVPMFIIFIVPNYWALVYRPAMSASQHRKEKIRTLHYEGSVQSKATRLRTDPLNRRSSVTAYCRKVIIIAKRFVQYCIIQISYSDSQRGKNKTTERVWCDMNLSNCGGVAVPALIQARSKARSALSPRYGNKVSNLMFPEDVTNMMSGNTIWKKEYLVTQNGSKKGDTGSAEQSDPIVLMNMSDYIPRRAALSRKIYNTKDALMFLESQLSDYTNAHNLEILNVDETDVLNAFQQILEILSPDGIALSEIEKSEAREMYSAWQLKQEFQILTSVVDFVVVEKRMIRFSAFRDWFSRKILSVLDSNLSNRLMDHSLRHVPHMKKRLQTADSKNLFDTSLAKSELRANMKGLNTVTACSLEASFR